MYIGQHVNSNKTKITKFITGGKSIKQKWLGMVQVAVTDFFLRNLKMKKPKKCLISLIS